MPIDYTTEELVINDSFINYCLGRNAEDIRFWEDAARSQPGLQHRMEEAAEIVLGLHVMLQRDVPEEGWDDAAFRVKDRSIVRGMLPYAAAVLVLLAAGWMVWRTAGQNDHRTDHALADGAGSVAADGSITYVSQLGERRFFVLPDSTRVNLGAGSTLRLSKGFSETDREVFLSGEALFEVPPNVSLPFIVHSPGQDINVLGTTFNVKAYPDEPTCETSLLRGKVEVTVPGSKRRWALQPNQKLIVSRESPASQANRQSGPVVLLPLTYSSKDSAVIETVWTTGRLEIVNENFGDIVRKLERWYNVEISLDDKEVAAYTFTATFTHENIAAILEILQHTYHFNYQISGNRITITK